MKHFVRIFLLFSVLSSLFSISSGKIYGQCDVTVYPYLNLRYTAVASCASGITYANGYLELPQDITRPITVINVYDKAGRTAPTYTLSDSLLMLNNIPLQLLGSMYSDLEYVYLDGCGNQDTLYTSAWSFPLQYVYSNNSSYNYCEQDLTLYLPINFELGYDTIFVTKYNYMLGEYDTLSNSSSLNGDTLVINDLNISPLNSELYSYTFTVVDECGQTYIISPPYNLSNYYYSSSGNGTFECNGFGLQNLSFTPNLTPPFSLLYYTKGGIEIESTVPEPIITFEGDSITIDGIVPDNYYNFYFLAGCGDTFLYSTSVNTDQLKEIFPTIHLSEKTCDSTYSVYFIDEDGGNYTNAIVENHTYYGTIPYPTSLTVVDYGDSVVISGFPKTSVGVFISIKDISCNSTQFAFIDKYSEMISPETSSFPSIGRNCEEGILNTIYGKLRGLPPFSFTVIKGPSYIDITTVGDSLFISNIPSYVNPISDTIIKIAIQDACGIIDTISVMDYQFNDYINRNIVYEVGGCSGINNAMAKIALLNTSGEPLIISDAIITGPGTPAVVFTGSTLTLSNLNPVSVYTIELTYSCGYKTIFNYQSIESNSDVLIQPKTIITGSCLDASNVDGHYGIKGKATGINFPYTVYLNGPTLDTIENVNTDTFIFENILQGTYDIVTIDVCNNINTQNYVIESPTYETWANAYDFKYKGCDSFTLLINLYKRFTGYNLEDHSKIPGPIKIFSYNLSHPTDTFWYEFENEDTLYSQYFTSEVTFPHPINFSNSNMIGIIDGCNDTTTTYYYHNIYINYNINCVAGTMYNRYLFHPLSSYTYNFNYPLNFEFVSGTATPHNQTLNSANDSAYWNIGVDEYAVYELKDSCDRVLQTLYLNPPSNLYHYSYTRQCYIATDGRHKGNAISYIYYAAAGAPLKFTFISGPQVVFDSLISTSGSLTLNNVDTGTYEFQVTEMNDCGRSIPITVRVEPFIDSMDVQFTPGCLNANIATIYYYNNVGSFDYNIMNAASASLALSSPSSGFYRSASTGTPVYNIPSNVILNITNYTSCGKTSSITTPNYLGPRIRASAGFTCADGFTLAIMGDRGVAPYTYEILSGSPVNYTVAEQSSNIFTGLPAVSGNVYQVRLKDACNNAFTTYVRADSVNNPLVESGFACIGSNYTAYVDSIPNISYTWNGPGGFVHNGRSFVLHPVTDTDTGLYTLTLTNTITGCATTIAHQVNIIDCELGVEITGYNNDCYGGNQGKAVAEGFGGASPYTFLWSTGATTDSIENLSAGVYSVTISDANGETATSSIEILQNDSIELTYTKVDVTCNAGTNGSIDISIVGGIAPYYIEWSNDSITEDLSELAAGDYTVIVTDQSGCSNEITISISEPDVITTTPAIENVSCNGAEDGTIDLNVTGGTEPYTYLWSNGASTENISLLSPGTFNVTVTDANGCTNTVNSMNITQPSELSASIIEETATSCAFTTDGSVIVNVSGGTPPYTYNWDNGATTSDLINVGSGTYVLTITDFNLCNIELTATVNPGNCVPTAVNDSFTTTKNTNINESVTQNDELSGDGNNTWSLIGADGGAVNGTVTMGTDGSFTYIPNTDYVGTDIFTYQICDANGDCDTATVFLRIESPLNLQLLKFDVWGKEDCITYFEWEINDNKIPTLFTLEQSKNGRTFESIADMKSNESQFVYSYSHNELNNEATLYYRLKLTETNGAMSYSNIIPIMINCKNGRTIRVYPTVSKDLVYVDGLNDGEHIQLYDVTGRLMLQMTAGANKETVNINQLAAGMYQLIISSSNNNNTFQFKIIKE